MNARPLPPLSRLVQDLPAAVPFVGPEQQERDRGRSFAARIGANESVFGPSPRALEAMAREAAEAWKYGDPTSRELREALAGHLGVAPGNVVVGEGIDGLLGLTVRLFVDPGDVVVTSAGAYPTFNYHVAGFGGRLVTVPYHDDAEDPDALARAAREHEARLVYLANPDNPMGSWHEASTIQRLLDALPERCVLCLDEAYVEFAPDEAVPEIDISDPRVIRFRTFSKAQGLAGARIGHAVTEARIATAFDRVRNHFGVNRIGQAGALAALGDAAHLQSTRQRVAASRAEIGRIATMNGLAALPSATNFVAIDCGHDGTFARLVLHGLLARDIFVRMPGVAPLDRCIRVSCGTERDMALFAEALPAALAEAEAALIMTAANRA